MQHPHDLHADGVVFFNTYPEFFLSSRGLTLSVGWSRFCPGAGGARVFQNIPNHPDPREQTPDGITKDIYGGDIDVLGVHLTAARDVPEWVLQTTSGEPAMKGPITKPEGNKSPELRTNEKKWGKPLMEAGWTLLPNTVLHRQAALGLTSTDVNILLHLVAYWWKETELPHPSKVTLATSIGVTPRTVQRRIAAMEHAGFIQRVRRQGPHRGTQTNLYDFSGLIKAATPYAKEMLEERAAKVKDQAARAGRKGRPNLRLVEED
jgi:predicted transcriptional regulator